MDGFATALDRHAPHLKSRTIIRYEKVVSFYRFVAYIMSIDFFSAPLRENYKSNLQTLDDSPVFQMLLDDFTDIGLIGIAVPDRIGIDDQHGTFLAAVETAGVVDTAFSRAGHFELFQAIFRIIAKLPGIVILATSRAVLALIGAKKYMVFKVTHLSQYSSSYG